MKYTKEEAIAFEQSDDCRKCVCRESCVSNYPDMLAHVVNCPRIFNWKIGFKSFVSENEEYLREHPEIEEQRQQKIKKWLATKRKIKKKI